MELVCKGSFRYVFILFPSNLMRHLLVWSTNHMYPHLSCVIPFIFPSEIPSLPDTRLKYNGWRCALAPCVINRSIKKMHSRTRSFIAWISLKNDLSFYLVPRIFFR